MIKVLMAEDIANTSVHWQTKLEPLGIDVKIVALPTTAMTEAASLKYDLVMMDVLFENYEDSGVLHRDRIEGDVAGVQIFNRFNIPILYITFAPGAVTSNSEADKLAKIYGLVDKHDLHVNAEAVASTIRDAIETHKERNRSNGVCALDVRLQFTCVNESAKSYVAPLTSPRNASCVWDANTVGTLERIVSAAKQGQEAATVCTLMPNESVLRRDGVRATVTPLKFHGELVGVRCEWNGTDIVH